MPEMRIQTSRGGVRMSERKVDATALFIRIGEVGIDAALREFFTPRELASFKQRAVGKTLTLKDWVITIKAKSNEGAERVW